MSNEEVVALIQSGERDRLMDLWQQVRRMVLKEANKWVVYHSNGVEMADLEQAGFIALMRAVADFDSSTGFRFSSWYRRFLETEFAIATGRRTEKQRRDPLQSAISLDTPVGEDEDSATLGELLPDPGAAQAFETVEARDRQARLHNALDHALSTLPHDLRSAIVNRYYCGKIVDGNAHSKAIRTLRHPKRSNSLREYVQ